MQSADARRQRFVQDEDAVWQRFEQAAARLQGEPGRQRRWAEALPGPELAYCAAWGDGWRVLAQAAPGDRWMAHHHRAEVALAQVCVEVRDQRRPPRSGSFR